MKSKQFYVFCSVSALLGAGALSQAAKKKDDGSAAGRETVARPLTEKEQKRKEAKLRKELQTPYKKWLTEDVGYIITDEERQAWKRLATDEEREQFIEQFWLRRDPTPDTEENEYKEEHYRRIAYANERFASGIPGWKTDRGRIYITYGPPDEIDSHPSGGSYERPIEEGGGNTSTFPFEKWRYRYIEGVGSGTNIEIEFVDPTMTGEYRMTMDPSEKDALLYVPNAGLTMMEQMGLSSKTDRFNRTDGTHLGTGLTPQSESMNQFSRLQQFADLQKAPKVKFRDLEEMVSSHVKFNILPMQVRADYIPLVGSTCLTNVTILFENHDLQFQDKEGVSKSAVNIFARITSLTGRRVNTFEDTVTVEGATALLQDFVTRRSIYQKSVPLAPGMYRLTVVAKDVIGGNTNSYQVALNVPRLEDEKLASSSIIVADQIEKVPTKSVGSGQFVIGASKVRPRVGEIFKKDEKLGLYMKLYNFGPDEKTQKPNGTIDYTIYKSGTDQKVLEYSEDIAKVDGASATQVTIEKMLPLQSFAPGTYTIKVKVVDKNRNQTLTPTATFTVT